MNIKEIIPSGLYKCTQPKKYYNRHSDDNYQFLYHCKNWTFTPRIDKNGDITMLDTYYSAYESGINLTEKNIADFELIFDFNDVVGIKENEYDEYDVDDVYRVAVDSGGGSFPQYFKKKEAKMSKERLLEKYEKELSSAEWRVNSLKSDIEKIKSGEHWKLK
jgi:hypothetical protein